jgi:hypothetical protein
MPVIINKIKEKDMEDFKDNSKDNLVTVVNISDQDYAGIPPGKTGTIDFSRWAPYQFALKKLRKPNFSGQVINDKTIIKNKKDTIEITGNSKKTRVVPKETILENELPSLKILLNAFSATVGGSDMAAVLLGIPPQQFRAVLASKVSKQNPHEYNLDKLMEYLNEHEQAVFKQKIIEICQELQTKPQKQKKSTTKKEPKNQLQ